MSIKGYSSQGKEERLSPQFATVEQVREKQFGLSVNAHMFTYSVGTDAVEASSSTSVINATAHAAKVGDIIRFTSGALSSQEVVVAAVSTDTITVAEDLTSAPAAAVTFEILRHKYPVVNADGTIATSAGATSFNLDSVLTQVNEDTSVSANNKPLPVKLLDSSGNENQVAATQSGTWNITNVSGTVSLPTGASSAANQLLEITSLGNIDTSTSGLNAKFGSLGQKTMAGSAPVVLASDSSALPASQSGSWTVAATQSGTWNLNNISGTIVLPTGASSAANQLLANTSLGNIDTSTSGLNAKFGSLGQKTMSGSSPVTISSDQSAIPASQSGTWNITNISGTISLPTGASTESTLSTMSGKLPATLGQKTSANSMSVVVASDQSTLTVTPAGLSAVDKARKDYSGGSVTTSAYTQLIASTAGTCKEVEIFDSSGQTLLLATGAAASEVDKIYIFPGGNGRVPLTIASGTRISVKAVSATASTGELSINLYG